MQIATTTAPTPRTIRRVRWDIRPRVCASARSLAAVVVRSSMIAITTIARLGTAAAPTSRFCSACTTGWPRPGPLTKAAMVAIDSAASVHWLMPTHDRPAGHRQLDLAQQLPRVTPSESAASTVVGDTDRMPCSAIRTSGGRA